MRMWLLILPLFILACTPPPTVVTEPGRQAFAANVILTRVENLQDAAIAAYRSGDLPQDTSRAIVFATVEITEVADAAREGWRAAVLKVWQDAKATIPQLQTGRLVPYVAAIDEVIGGPR